MSGVIVLTVLSLSHVSACLQGYVATSASLRGQQLADLSKGKRPQNGKIFTDSLTDKHDFEAPVPNTVNRNTIVTFQYCTPNHKRFYVNTLFIAMQCKFRCAFRVAPRN